MQEAPALRCQFNFDDFDFRACDPQRLDELLRYLLAYDGSFLEKGDANLYFQLLTRLTDHLHAQVFANPTDPFWLHVASIYARRMKPLSLYFTSQNVRNVMTKRGDLFELVLRAAGHPIDHKFPPRNPKEKIRLGVLSSAIRHGTSTSAVLPLFEHLDRDRFEVILYQTQPQNSAGDDYYRQRVTRVVETTEDLRALIAAVRKDNLDLLLFIANAAAGANLWSKAAAHRLARVQITDFAAPITTGLRNVDAFISGKLSELSDAQDHYREELHLIDGPGFCLDRAACGVANRTRDRAAFGLADNASVFTSGANFYKLTPELLDTWSRIINAVPNSLLVLYPFGPLWSDQYPQQDLARRLAQYFAPHQLKLLPTLPNRAEVQSMLKAIADITLDSFPHSGSHSLFDALELAIPSVALLGKTLRGRHGAAILLDMGLNEMVTTTTEDYIALATKLGLDKNFRSKLARRGIEAMQKQRITDSKLHAQRLHPIYELLANR